MAKRTKHVLFITFHLPLSHEPGAFRPWMEALLLQNAGFKVTVVTSGVHYMTGKNIQSRNGWFSEEIINNIRILKVWNIRNFRGSGRKRLLNYFIYTFLAGLVSVFYTKNIDRVLAGTDPIFITPMAYLVSKIKRAPLVLDERDLYPETAIALNIVKDSFFTHFLFCMQQFFRRAAIGLLAATPGIKDRLVSYGCHEEKVHLLYNADVFLNRNNIDIADDTLKRETGKKFLAGYAGGLGKANDIPTLLKAAEQLQDLDSFGIVIIGDGEQRQIYEQCCLANGLKNVFFKDSVAREQARMFISQMDVCVQPLLKNKHFHSTLTSKTFDYHGLGRPMVFCGEGNTVSLLNDSNGGIAVPPEDDNALAEAIRLLYEDESIRKKMGAMASQWFDRNITIDKASIILKEAMVL